MSTNMSATKPFRSGNKNTNHDDENNDKDDQRSSLVCSDRRRALLERRLVEPPPGTTTNQPLHSSHNSHNNYSSNNNNNNNNSRSNRSLSTESGSAAGGSSSNQTLLTAHLRRNTKPVTVSNGPSTVRVVAETPPMDDDEVEDDDEVRGSHHGTTTTTTMTMRGRMLDTNASPSKKLLFPRSSGGEGGQPPPPSSSSSSRKRTNPVKRIDHSVHDARNGVKSSSSSSSVAVVGNSPHRNGGGGGGGVPQSRKRPRITIRAGAIKSQDPNPPRTPPPRNNPSHAHPTHPHNHHDPPVVETLKQNSCGGSNPPFAYSGGNSNHAANNNNNNNNHHHHKQNSSSSSAKKPKTANTVITRFFRSTTKSSPATNTATAAAPAPPCSEIDSLRDENAELRAEVTRLSSELSGVRNSISMKTISLQDRLARSEEEKRTLEQQRNELQRRTERMAIEIEESLLERTRRRDRETRRRLAVDGARLGRFTYQRDGLRGVVERWENGDARRELDVKKEEWRRRTAELEKERRETLERYEKESRNSEPIPKDDYNAMEWRKTEVSFRMRADLLAEAGAELDREERALLAERNAHVRELRRVESEEKSRFHNKPKLNDRYVLLNLLGKGGFSEVWRAHDLHNSSEVAVKIHQLDSRWSESKKANYTKHVVREFEIHRGVRHPNIVNLHGHIEIDDETFATVLECCRGTDLDALLRRKGRLSERDARAVTLQILAGMAYLSTPSKENGYAGIIHYDLKPANILFDDAGTAKITDFGLSKIVDGHHTGDDGRMELTSQGAGTYWYLPPECFATHGTPRIDSRVDVWSIGVILYQMLYGKRPFGDGLSQERILMNRTMLDATEVVFPKTPWVGEACKAFVRRCLTHDQTHRPTVTELCRDPYVTGEEPDENKENEVETTETRTRTRTTT